MKGIVVTTKNEMRVQEFSNPAHKSIGEAVGGWIEVVHPVRLKRPYCMIVNEEGVLLNLPMNAFGSFLYGIDCYGSPILGDIVLLKEGINSDGEPDILGLDEQDIKYLCDMVPSVKKSVEESYCNPCKAEGKDHNGCWCRACWVGDMLDEVDAQPTVDAVPVQRGKWGKLYADTEPAAEAKQIGFLCSECMFKRDIDADFGRAIACPTCGADMREVEHE